MGLGGGVNLTREPRGGRGFEYLGEDLELAGELIAQRTLGTQSEHVIASVKHLAGNEQETNRSVGNTTVDERTLRELYLLPFEIAVERAIPAA
jgi:beta-glucosidase